MTDNSSASAQVALTNTGVFKELPPAAQKAFLQEQLDNSMLFRQTVAMRNGIPAQVHRNVIDDMTQSVNITATSAPTVSPVTAAPVQIPDTPPVRQPQTTPVAEAAKTAKNWWPMVAAATGLLGLGTAGGTIAANYLFKDKDPVPATSIDTDKQVLDFIHSRGIVAPETPLGDRVLEAFEKRPELREEVMKKIEEALTNDN